MSEDFDLSKFVTRHVTSHGKRIAIGTLPNKTEKKKRRKSFEAGWVKFPLRRFKALQRSKRVATHQLAEVILFEAFKRDQIGGEIILSATVTKMLRGTRRRAVKELVELNLIKVEQNGNQAIKVTKIYTK